MTPTERAAIIGQLVAMDNVLHGVLESLQAAEEKPECEHPEEQRNYKGGTMGSAASFTCQQCGTDVPGLSDVRERIVRSNTPAGA